MKPGSSAATLTRQRGAALLVAMITVMLMTTLAATALWRSWRGVEVEAAERARVQSAWILTGALDWARLILEGDLSEDARKQPATDHLSEPWAIPLAEARLSTFLAADEGGAALNRDAFLSGQITDLQARLNFMNLAAGSASEQREALLQFRRLYDAIALPATGLEALQQALLQAQRPTAAGDNTGAPLLPTRFDQLAWLGVDAKTLEHLAPYATLLPLDARQPTPVNINTADAEVIYAALPALDRAQAQRLVALRDERPFTSVATALGQIGVATTTGHWAVVASRFFEIRARLRLDDVIAEEVSAVQRLGAGNAIRVKTLWRKRVALTVTSENAGF